MARSATKTPLGCPGTVAYAMDAGVYRGVAPVRCWQRTVLSHCKIDQEGARMKDSATQLPLIAHAKDYAARSAILDSEGRFTYESLLDGSARVASALLNGLSDLSEQRVLFLVAPGFAWVAVQWGIWRAG